MSQGGSTAHEGPCEPVPPTSTPELDARSHRPGRGHGHGRGHGRDVRLVVTGVVLALLAWFALANLQTVRIRFWLTSAHAPLILVIVISGVLGALVPGVWSRVTRRRRVGGDS